MLAKRVTFHSKLIGNIYLFLINFANFHILISCECSICCKGTLLFSQGSTTTIHKKNMFKFFIFSVALTGTDTSLADVVREMALIKTNSFRIRSGRYKKSIKLIMIIMFLDCSLSIAPSDFSDIFCDENVDI